MPKFCSECGKAVVDVNSEFCSGCGAKIQGTNDTSRMKKAEEYVPIRTSPQPVIAPEPPAQKRSTKEWIAICCGGIILLVVVSAIITAMVNPSATASSSSYKQPSVPPTLSIAQIKNAAQNIPYDDLFRYNERYVGKTVYFRGKIVQQESVYGDNYVFRVATEKNDYLGYLDDVVYVHYTGPRYLEDDIVDFWAKVDGLKSYTAVLGNSITIPEVTTLHTELVSKASEQT